MAHKHPVYDTDPHFKVDGDTRVIINMSDVKVALMQGDHNSERFTFEIPRYVDGHDMSLCNICQIHYLNVGSSTRATNAGIYEVEDLQFDSNDEQNRVVLSWLISSNVTMYVGSLSFVIRFGCSTDGVVDYIWNTAVHSGITISSSICNSETVVQDYTDILEQWRDKLFSTYESIIDKTLTKSGQAADAKVTGDSVTALKEDIDNLENDDLTLSQGYIPIKLIANKFLSSSGITDYTGWSATENIKVDGLDYIYTEWSKASSYNKFLDSNFGLVKMVTIKDGLQKTNIPEGSCYVAFSNETTVMEGLRVWSPTKVNLYENTLEISKLKQDIPFYYEKHLTDKITEVRAKETFSGVNGDEFVFITDYHMERNANNSPSLIDKIIHQTGAKKIVFGGDAYDASSTTDLALNKIADFYSMFYENADKILSCVGNHEYNNPASNKPEQQIPNGQVYASIVNRNDLIHHSRHTCNYTIINRSNETMYIFVGCEYSSSITNESIKYVLETIKNNNGYDIIVFFAYWT